MKILPLDIGLFPEKQGISCVENLLLYILRANNFPYTYLYYKSYRPFIDVLHYSINNKLDYANNDMIERLQKTATDEGYIDLRYLDDISDIRYKDSYICVMVSPIFSKDIYQVSLARADHFILLGRYEQGKYTYINDIPQDINTISENTLNTYLNNKGIAINVCSVPGESTKKQYLTKMVNELTMTLGTIETGVPNVTDLLLLRDALLIHKIIMRRAFEFLNAYIKCNDILNILTNIETFCNKVEYMRLRKIYDEKRIYNMIIDICSNEKKIVETLFNRIQEEGLYVR